MSDFQIDLSGNCGLDDQEIIAMKRGQVLFVEGESSAYLYIVISGKIRVVKEQENGVVPISIIGDKSFLGELSMFSDEPRSASAIAETDLRLVKIKKSEIRKVIKLCPVWVREIMETLSERLRLGSEILLEHNIVDNSIDNNNEMSPERGREIFSAIESYRKRRNLNISKG